MAQAQHMATERLEWLACVSDTHMKCTECVASCHAWAHNECLSIQHTSATRPISDALLGRPAQTP